MQDARPILLLGAGGQLGREFVAAFAKQGTAIIAASSQAREGLRQVDICARDSLLDLVADVRPGVVINASAYTAVDQAEKEPEIANAVNAGVPRMLAETCASQNAVLIHFSTDYVFDGVRCGAPIDQGYTEGDTPSPLNEYGRSKLRGEQGVLAVDAGHYVFRTSWLYTPGGRNFVSTMLRLFQGASPVRVVDDQYGCPTWARDVAREIVGWLSCTSSTTLQEQAGLYHLCSSGQCSWYEFAAAIRQRTVPAALAELLAIDTATFAAPAPRPSRSILDCTLAAKRLNLRLPTWLDALDAAMPAFNDIARSERQ
jgi:dTDP-4-dehydrorhamnose reductase